MSRPDPTPDLAARRRAIASLWVGVVEDAGFSPDEVAYWNSEETPSEIRDRAAMYFLPGPNPDPPYAFTDAQFEEATADDMCERHRIMVHVDYELPADLEAEPVKAFFAAILRHELEHARQAQAPGGRLALEVDQNLVDPVLFERAGGIKGGAEYYNMKPSELDANAAASVYVRSRFPDEVPVLLEAEACGAMLRSNTEAEDPASLLRRTVCFLFQFRSIAEALSEPLPVASRLDLYGGADAAAIWDHLTA
jgi:hypothetical protein